MDLFELENQYLKAKEAYYNGEPMMSDEEFDDLEELLKTLDSDVINLVGTVDRRFKFQHLSGMTSLDKIQASIDNVLPMDKLIDWFSKFPKGTIFEATSKYDGMAINLVYRKGNLERAITRGDKLKGKDATAKLMRRIPLTLDIENDVEVRGECVIPFQIFNDKYLNHPDETVRKYKNPRNFVAGVINREETTEDLLNEICFMAVEARIHDGDYEYPNDTIKFLTEQGFNKKDFFYKHFTFTPENFQKVYNEMKEYREKVSPFQLDGFVVKAPEHMRKEIGESGHHPNWAVAIKFPPKRSRTKVVGLKYRVGVTGEIIPGIMLHPVDLDGTVIRNTAGFNMGYIIEKGLFPGAEVEIVKSGDIIPIVSRVIKPEFNGDVPTHCICGAPVILDGIHLQCQAEECGIMKLKRFINGVGIYRMDKWGGAARRLVFEAGFTEIWQVFDRDFVNKDSLISSGKFKDGKTLNNLLEEMEKIEKVSLAQIIVSLGFDGVGRTAAKQLARYIRGKEYDFSGLEKAALIGFNPGEKKREKVEQLVRTFQARGVEVEEEVVLVDGIGYELTGSPKDAGFPVKSDLEKFLLSHGYIHTGLKEAKYLLTDSISSSSGKMKDAKKRGVEIVEYSVFIKRLKNGIRE